MTQQAMLYETVAGSISGMISAGTLFSATDRYRNCIRMGCAEPWSPRVQQALVKLGDLLKKQLCPSPAFSLPGMAVSGKRQTCLHAPVRVCGAELLLQYSD